jgi:Uncharacterized conserved protein
MLNIKMIVLAEIKEKYFVSACDEYKKRLSGMCKLSEIVIKEERLPENPTAGEIEDALMKEAAKIAPHIPQSPHSYTITLCVEGTQFTSEELADKIKKLTSEQSVSELCLIIGSSHGLHKSIKEASNLKLSISKLTFPHTMMRPLMYEVVYRTMSILNNKKYHK